MPKLTLKNLWLVPLRFVLITPFWVLVVLGTIAETVGQRIADKLPKVDF